MSIPETNEIPGTNFGYTSGHQVQILHNGIVTRVASMDSFDFRDTIIPFSLLQIANHFQQMKPGEEIEIIGNDPSIARDIKKILPSSEYTIISAEKEQAGSRDFRLQLKKNPRHNPKGKKEKHHVRNRSEQH
ncbi:MAG: sulfurtransferase TusA family protein [Desulfosarcina sp.]|nr:sulfurtransferase TusA family protein [Desulfobacterales bacterium]